MKRIAILGSSGSIGKTTLRVVNQYRSEFSITALTVNKNIGVLKEQIAKFHPKKIAITDGSLGKLLSKEFKRPLELYYGIEGLEKIAQDKDVDIVVIALSGAVAIFPLLAAIKAGKHIAIANKEAIVMAGAIIMRELKRSSSRLIPIDSEQSAIFQCLEGRDKAELKKIYLTASGGALYDVDIKNFKYLKQREILRHPRWKMGRKITVDSATLMNKGLEVIEAKWLFDIDVSNIKVLIHRQVLIHSMVEFIDGNILAQLGVTDMALPIQYALSYPRRLSNNKCSLDFSKIGALSFEKPNTKKFPCLDFAYTAASQGGTAPCAMNAANEEAVSAFLNKRIGFVDIIKIIEKVMSRHRVSHEDSLSKILEADNWAREEAKKLISQKEE